VTFSFVTRAQHRAREQHRDGEPSSCEPQVFDLLVYLSRNSDRVVSKDDLIESVRGGQIVSSFRNVVRSWDTMGGVADRQTGYLKGALICPLDEVVFSLRLRRPDRRLQCASNLASI